MSSTDRYQNSTYQLYKGMQNDTKLILVGQCNVLPKAVEYKSTKVNLTISVMSKINIYDAYVKVNLLAVMLIFCC